MINGDKNESSIESKIHYFFVGPDCLNNVLEAVSWDDTCCVKSPRPWVE